MKNLKFASLGILTVLFFSTGLAFAGDSKAIGVSCVIPAIPGVNAPPFPEGVKDPTAGQFQNTIKNDSQEKKQTSAAQESPAIIVAKDLKDPQIQTIYSR